MRTIHANYNLNLTHRSLKCHIFFLVIGSATCIDVKKKKKRARRFQQLYCTQLYFIWLNWHLFNNLGRRLAKQRRASCKLCYRRTFQIEPMRNNQFHHVLWSQILFSLPFVKAEASLWRHFDHVLQAHATSRQSVPLGGYFESPAL